MVKLLLKVKVVGLYGGQVSGGKNLKSGVKSITMKMVLFILVYTIKRRHIITIINFKIEKTKFCNQCTHACVREYTC